jgi:hypothetical protein
MIQANIRVRLQGGSRSASTALRAIDSMFALMAGTLLIG